MLGEEHGLEEGANGRRWVIDPVDGTKLYAEGIPLWTTLIALEIDGAAVLGVADAPAIGDRHHAVRGEGAWRGGRRLHVSDVSTLAGSFLAHSGIEEWIACYFGGTRIDTTLNGVINWFLVLPWIALAIALTAVIGPTLVNVIVVIAWASTARVVRSQALS